MAFELTSVVPWGRNLEEYRAMFDLSEADLDQKLIGFGDGPASVNAELSATGRYHRSIDPIYAFSSDQLSERFEAVKEEVMVQVRQNLDNFTWKNIKDPDELLEVRSAAMRDFLLDFEQGKKAGRYIYHELPQRLPFSDRHFDLGLSSHFLLLYENLGLDFHLASLTEMLRVCREVRVFPILNLNAERSVFLKPIIHHFSDSYHLRIEQVDYEFQKNGNELLRIFHRYP